MPWQGAGRRQNGHQEPRGAAGDETSTACCLSIEPSNTPLKSVGAHRALGTPSTLPKQTWASTPGNTPHRCPPQPPPAEPGARPSPVRECNRLLGKVCRISGRVSSSPGKQQDTHGQGGRAGPLCYSAHGTRWQEAAPCSGRNAWGETGHSVRPQHQHPHLAPTHPGWDTPLLPPRIRGSSLAVCITPKSQPGHGEKGDPPAGMQPPPPPPKR